MKELLVIGSGAREHALVWKARQSPQVTNIYCAPGNPGIAEMTECVPIKTEETERLANFAEDKKIDLTIVGPEVPLKLGIVDVFESRGLTIFGPSQQAAQIETSKVFAKRLMEKYDIPTSPFENFTLDEIDKANEYIEKHGAPLVVKADGIAAAKGAIVAEDIETAQQASHNILIENIFPDAGDAIVIEDFLEGDEISLTAICSGTEFVPMLLSQDHKKIFDNNKGKNTGGMGVCAPLPFVNPQQEKELYQIVTKATLNAMAQEGINYKGVLYSNVMLTKNGPMVLEHNARFGDPEAQTLFPLSENDLIEILTLALENKLHKAEMKWSGKYAVCLTLASSGYPDKYETGKVIEGIEDVQKMKDVIVFHAGTEKKDGKLVTAGGRVLSVVALDTTLAGAVKKAYEAAAKINWEGVVYRRDIARRGLTHVQ